MIELCVILLVIGALWLAVSLVGVVFKLVFGLIGGIFSLIGGLLALGVGLALLPVVVLFALPFFLPLLFVIGLVWLIARAARRPPAPVPASATH